MSQKLAFVTGANGFIGVNLCRKLKEENWKVIALTREESNTTYLDELDVEKCNASISNLDELKKLFPQKVDAVFHLAGVTSQFHKDYERQFKVNVEGTENIIECCEEFDVGRLIHVSSIMAFGLHDHTITEETKSNADSIGNNYAHSKWLGENLVMDAAKNGLDSVIVNPSHIIGPYDTANFIQLFESIDTNTLPGVPPGSGMFCHVKDVCESLIKAYHLGKSGEKYLIGGHYLSFKEVAQEIQSQLGKKKSLKVFPKWLFNAILPFYTLQSWITGKEPLLTKGKIEITCSNIQCDDSLARKTFDLNYRTLEEMVSDTLDYYRKYLKT